MKIKETLALLFVFFFFALKVNASRSTDSLKTLLSSAKEDTSKAKVLLSLSKEYYSSEPAEAIRYAGLAKKISEELHFHRGIALALKYTGIAYYNQGKYLETLDYWNQSMAAFDSSGDKLGVANILNNIGSVYYDQADYDQALDYYLKSLEISEKFGDTVRVATAMTNIGNIYGFKKATYDQALDYYFRALTYSEAINDKVIMGTIEVGVGEIYLNRNNFDSALYFFNKSLIAYAGTEAVPYSLNDIGKVYTKKGDYVSAANNHKRALEFAEKLESKLDIVQSLLGLGSANVKQGENNKAIENLKRAQLVAEAEKFHVELKDIYRELVNAYTNAKDCNNALLYQTLLTEIKDTLYNTESDKKLGRLQFEFDLQKKQGQLDLKELDLKRQKVIKNVTIGGLAIVLMFFVVVFLQKKRITKEKKRSDELLLNILPSETAEELKATGTAKAKSFDLVTVLFTDFKNFTQASEILTADELVQEINYCYSEFDRIITRYGIEKIKTIGDAYMCAGGLPVSNTTHPVDVVSAGLEMQHFILKNKKEREEKGQPFFELRVGIHTGPVVAGIVGIKKFAYDIWGDTVNTASRMESSGEVGKVNISGATFELIKEYFVCLHRGKIQAKNKGEIDMYFVEKAV